LDVSDFLKTKLPGFIAGIQAAHAVFITYSEVTSYGRGIVPTDKKGLTIEIRRDNGEYSPPPDRPYRLIPPEKHTAALAFIYAGLSCIEDSLAFVSRVKHDNPGAKIVIVTCDCSTSRKRAAFAQLSPCVAEEIVETPECGGRGGHAGHSRRANRNMALVKTRNDYQ
jgi:hypothetical protein